LTSALPDRAGIGGGREQTDDAELAHELAVAVETLHAHVVHVDAPVHARAHRGLGDDEQRRLLEQRAHLRRDDEGLIPTLQHPHVARAQNAESGLEHGLERVLAGRECVVADAEEGEIVVREPFQERSGLGDLRRRQWRRIGLELGDHVRHARGHRPPVLNAEADIGKRPLDRLDDLGAARFLLDTLDMDVDDAFAQRAGGGLRALEGGETAGRVAHDAQHGMHDETDFDPALGELGQDRIHQERHVVVDDLEHQIVAQPLVACGVESLETDLRNARFAHGEQRPCIRGKLGELARVVAHEVFGDRVGEQRGDEILGNLAIVAAQDVAGGRDQRRFGALFIGAGKVGGCHGVLPRRARRG
jgi:hypothetical protein